MMKIKIILILLLALPIALAAVEDNLNEYEYADINLKIDSLIDVNVTGNNPSIDFLELKLGSFPKNDNKNLVIKENINTNPNAVITKNKDNLIFNWNSPSLNKISFNLDYDVRVFNSVDKIKNKINYPSNIPQELINYTKETEYININEDIRKQATEIIEGETDYYFIVYQLAEWVRNNIRYDLNTFTESAVQRSTWVLRNREGVCDELTNLFISFLRSLGIPARFVAGVVYSNTINDFGNHGWAEVYFPGYGWIPFDVTFGQYGWLDPSHVKLYDTIDSGNPSAEFNWRYKDVDVTINPLNIKAKLINNGNPAKLLAKININTLKSKVGFGSFIPLEVNIENLQDYYLPLNLYITKAPGILYNESTKIVLLKPKEKKSVYLIITTEDKLDKNYLYKSEIEVQTNFNEKASSEILYSKDYETYSLQFAKDTINKLEEREEKEFLSSIALNCVPDKEIYYSNEVANIECIVKNNGNKNLNDLKICIKDNCKPLSLTLNEETKVKFSIDTLKDEKLKVVVENQEIIQSIGFDIEVIPQPNLKIRDMHPDEIGYNEDGYITLNLNSNTLVKDVTIIIQGIGKVELGDFEGDYLVEVPFKGSMVADGNVVLEIHYKDILNKDYKDKRTYNIVITKIPFYAYIIKFFKDMFYIH